MGTMSKKIITCVGCGERMDRLVKSLCPGCYAKKWREDNPERDKESKRKYREANEEKVKERRKKYDAKHRQENIERAKKWREANPERTIAVKKAYYESTKDERKAEAVKWRSENPEEHKKEVKRKRLKQYNMTFEDYDNLLIQQNYCCGITGCSNKHSDEDQLYIDHDHSTGAVRGLLCSQCNLGLGGLADTEERILAALVYLRSYKV